MKKKRNGYLFFFGEKLITPMLIGIVTFILTVFLKDAQWKYSEDLVIAILVVIIAFHIFMMYDFLKVYQLRKRIDKGDYIYGDIIDAHINLPHNYPQFIDSILTCDITKNGLVFLNVSNGDYLKWLESCALEAKKSFYATLTGDYLPSFFLKDKTNLNYLKKVNGITDIEKKRVLIFDKEEFLNDIKLLDLKDVRTFFDCQKTFKVYFLDRSQISQLQVGSTIDILIALESDFALLDRSLAFRRIGETELAYYFTNTDSNNMPNSFCKLFDDEILNSDSFRRIDINEILTKNTTEEILKALEKQLI